MTGRLVTEIMTFSTLQDLAELIDAEISLYTSRKEEYSERLGSFLRDAEEEYGDENWFKQVSLDKLGKGKGKKKKGVPEHWIPFKGMLLSSSVQGEAEIMFETIEAIEEKLEMLEEAKESVEDLRGVGLGNDIVYVCFVKDGVVSKILIKPTDAEAKEKFAFNRGFTTIRTIQLQR
ncbi:MAG: hypothetical protein ACETVY_03530 [Candidatus Bathyarchaeia archaeon]